MPRWKKKEAVKPEAKVIVTPPASMRDRIIAEESEKAPDTGGLSQLQVRINESRKILDVPLPTGQKLFEAADGMIIVGESDKDTIWYQEGDGGKGIRINPRR